MEENVNEVNPSFENKKYIPPWREPYIIGIAGCSGSGKTSIASSIMKKINVSQVHKVKLIQPILT